MLKVICPRLFLSDLVTLPLAASHATPGIACSTASSVAVTRAAWDAAAHSPHAESGHAAHPATVVSAADCAAFSGSASGAAASVVEVWLVGLSSVAATPAAPPAVPGLVWRMQAVLQSPVLQWLLLWCQVLLTLLMQWSRFDYLDCLQQLPPLLHQV